MKKIPDLNTIKDSIYKRLNSITVTLIGIFTLIGMGFTVGIYYKTVTSNTEISELKNKQSLELIELRNKQSLEIIELHKKISLLEIQNEKQKK